MVPLFDFGLTFGEDEVGEAEEVERMERKSWSWMWK